MKKLIHLTFLLILLQYSSEALHAQVQDEGNIDISTIFDIPELESYRAYSYNPLDIIRKKEGLPGIGPDAEIWNKVPWGDPAINFFPDNMPSFAGDINGDGYDDFIKFEVTSDERTSDISDYTNKTIVYFGGDNINDENRQVFYFEVLPLGDLNGDGFSDALAYNMDDSVYLAAGSTTGYEITEGVDKSQIDLLALIDTKTSDASFRTGEDINGDGIDDIKGTMFFKDRDTPNVYYELLGAPSFNDLVYNEYDIDSGYGISEYEASMVKKDTTYYLFTTNFLNDDTVRVEMYFKKEDTLKLGSTFKFPTYESSVHVVEIMDFTGDGINDILYESWQKNLYFAKGSASDDIFFEAFSGDIQSDRLFNSEESNSGSIIPIGDLDADGTVDLMLRTESSMSIHSVVTKDSTSLVEKISLNVNDYLEDGLFVYPSSQSNQQHIPKLSNNKNTVILNVDGENEYKHVVISFDTLTQNPFESYTIQTISYLKDSYRQTFILDIFYLGDLEGDGKDDFAVEILENEKVGLIIYNGFDEASSKEITVPEDFYVKEVYSGRFTSLDSKSIMVLFKPIPNSGLEKNESRIDIFEQDNYDSPAQSVLKANIGSLSLGVDLIANLGDVNKDGYDDIGVGVTDHLWIALGKESISQTPQIQIGYGNPSIPGDSYNVGTIQGAGDINGDGIDDFVVGDIHRNILSDEQYSRSSGRISGAVFIHFGTEDMIPDFSIPDAILYPDTSNLENRQWFFGMSEIASGDFDGDGDKDIAAKAFNHSDGENDEGAGAIHYYFNEGGFNTQPDTTIAIHTEYVRNYEVDEVYTRYGARELMAGIPDLDNDGIDELLYVPNVRGQNAVLYKVGSTPQENTKAIFNSPNRLLSMNPVGNYVNAQFRSVIGDFDGDGTLSFIVYQKDRNYRNQPLYKFNLTGVVVSNEEEIVSETPTSFSLSQNYPNPFNPTTNIEFSLAQAGNVKLTVYNVLGQEVAVLLNEKRSSGLHTINFDATQLSSGMYMYRLETSSNIQIRKMLLIK